MKSSAEIDAISEVFRDITTFMNDQIGTYMDALSGFSGNRSRILRQVHRYNRPTSRSIKKGVPTIVWTSYEDPSKPDVLHHEITRLADYLDKNGELGRNEIQQANALMVFLFSYWDEEIRPRLARAAKVEVSAIKCNAFGDLRLLRNAILHNRRQLSEADFASLKRLRDVVRPGEIEIGYEEMHRIMIICKNDLFRLFLEMTGIPEPPDGAQAVTGWAIQKGRA